MRGKTLYNRMHTFKFDKLFSKMLFIKTLGHYSRVVMKYINAHLRNETKTTYKGLNDFTHTDPSNMRNIKIHKERPCVFFNSEISDW